MGVLDDVVGAFCAAWVARKTSRLAKRVKLSGPPGDNLVNVRLVPGVPQDEVAGLSNVRCRASVSSTTPRFGPRCPPVADTFCTKKSRISADSCTICPGVSASRSRVGELSPAEPCRFPSPIGVCLASVGPQTSRSARRVVSAKRTGGCRRCGSSRLHPGCRFAPPHRTRSRFRLAWSR